MKIEFTPLAVNNTESINTEDNKPPRGLLCISLNISVKKVCVSAGKNPSINSKSTTSKFSIEKNVGIDFDGQFRESGDMGNMLFTRTLEDWAKFDISNRTKFDASISSGLAVMATQRHMYQVEKKQSKINLNFARYTNKGNLSELIR